MSKRPAIDRFGVVGYNHRQLPARMRGLLAFDTEWCDRLAKQLMDARVAEGVAFVSTCNRQEVLLSSDHPNYAIELVRAQMHSVLIDRSHAHVPEPYRHLGEDAVRHVLRVSASLDSLVIGERQITQQLRRSFDEARHKGWMDKALNGLARISVENAKEIHQRTTLSQESVGVFSLARDLVRRETAELGRRPRVAVVGLGEIGLKTARALAADGRVEVTVSSRRPRSKAELGSTLENVPFVPLEKIDELLRDMDAIVVATGARTAVVDEALAERVGRTAPNPCVVVDIGIPPQVDHELDGQFGLRVFNLDWFTTTGFGQRPQAREALRRAQEIVEEGVHRLAEWTSVRRYSGLFDSCVSLSEQFKAHVLPETIRGDLAHLTPEQQRAVHMAMHRLLTSYSEGLFQTLNRELNDHAPERVLPAASAAGAEDVHPEADDRHARQ